jgi:hypothetical protein
LNNELVIIIHALKSNNVQLRIKLCDLVVNEPDDENPSCFTVECNSCPLILLKTIPGIYTTQMTLTMEAVNHETRNPTPD